MANFIKQLKDSTKREIAGIFCFALAALSFLALRSRPEGLLGAIAVRLVYALFGQTAGIIPVVLALAGIMIMLQPAKLTPVPRQVGLALLALVGLAYVHLSVPAGEEFAAGFRGAGGGILGAFTLWTGRKLFGAAGAKVVLVTVGAIGLLLATGVSLVGVLGSLPARLGAFLRGLKVDLSNFIWRPAGEQKAPAARAVRRPTPKAGPESEYIWKDEAEEAPAPAPTPIRLVPERPAEKKPPAPAAAPAPEAKQPPVRPAEPPAYQLPPFTVLRGLRVIRGAKNRKENEDKSQLLEETLANFGVQAKVTDISRGPAITRYELQPAPGTRVSKVLSLADDIALSLAATDVRIEAPIPGKAAIGIEVPNEEVSIVPLREVLEHSEFTAAGGRLTVALGKDIAGTTILADLAKMVHVLVAGSTGSGKSVCINTIIASILFKSKPDEVKFLMVDPKVVELITYNGIPHLIAPVVTDPRKAAGALRWVVQEMESRYALFASSGVRDIEKYNQYARQYQATPPAGGEKGKEKEEAKAPPTPLPLIVVIVDELADLMMVAPVEVEDAICRLAQMARAAGIHLVVATQRPSVDVVTGLIKANIPSRISFAVASQVDSRTILDMNGAEKLLGKGDMLYFPVGASKPLRLQGAFISDKEVEALVGFWKQQAKPEYEQPVFEAPEAEAAGEDFSDKLFDDAVELILQADTASVSFLQRRMRIGYTRAARLIDMMEEQGIVGRHEGSKAREILITLDQWRRRNGQR